MGFFAKFILLVVLPQLGFWVTLTVTVGTLFGGLAAILMRSRTEGTETALP